MDTTSAAATGQHTTQGTPHGFTSLTPFHVVTDAAGALEFYQRVFGARVLDVTEMPDGQGGRSRRARHARLRTGAVADR